MRLFPSGCSSRNGAGAALIVVGILGWTAIEAESQPARAPASPSPSPTPFSAGVPLPIGQSAKGLVLPYYNLEGQLEARVEAAVAKRTDQDHIRFEGVKFTTFTPQNTPDLSIDMPTSVLDLNSRVITSQDRTTIRRGAVTIAGDTLRFDTNDRKGTLVGNVKMVITNADRLMEPSKR